MLRRIAATFSFLFAGLVAGCTFDLHFYVSGAGGAGGGATSLAGGGCVPGAPVACYGGPAGTENKGICTAGTKTCNPDGATYGPCSGEVLPMTEDCADPRDEDCDGIAPACQGIPQWSKGFGDAGSQEPTMVTVDTIGNVVIVGSFTGSVDFGGGLLTSAGDEDIFIAKFDKNGNHLWSERFGDADFSTASSVAVDAQGNVILSGYFGGVLDFGGDPLVGAGGTDVFVTKLDPEGHHVWSKRFGDMAAQVATGVAVDGSGNVILVGYFLGSMDFGGGPLAPAINYAAFVAKLGPDGAHLWSKRFGDVGYHKASGVALDGAGNIAIAGYFAGTIDFGGGPLTSPGNSAAFVTRLNSDGVHLWGKSFGDSGDVTSQGLAADGAGNIVLVGYFAGTVDFGENPLESLGKNAGFIATLHAGGAHGWSKSFGDSGDMIPNGVAMDGLGNIDLVGSFSDSVDFGNGPFASAGGVDAFIAKLDPSGKPVWSKRFGDPGPGDQGSVSVAMDDAGNSFLTGYFADSVNFGLGSLTSAGNSDIFLAKFSP